LHIDLVVACGTIPPSLVQHDMLIGFERSETDIKARSDGENRVMKDYLREYSLCLPFSFLRDAASRTSNASDGLPPILAIRIIVRGGREIAKSVSSPARRRKPCE
jgi:hypothetical protein